MSRCRRREERVNEKLRAGRLHHPALRSTADGVDPTVYMYLYIWSYVQHTNTILNLYMYFLTVILVECTSLLVVSSMCDCAIRNLQSGLPPIIPGSI